jgi:acetyltransferase-like isoleucine patch superfamily enzyme
MLSFMLPLYYRLRPQFIGFLIKLFFSNQRIKIGKNFKCDSFPKLEIDRNAKLAIGDNVTFRRNVELRIHGNSRISIADNNRIDRGVRLLAANNSEIQLFKNCRIGLYTVFNGGDSITIGQNTLISGFVYLQTSMHDHESSKPIQDQGFTHEPIIIGNDNWLGTHSIIFPGVHLGKGCIVGSSALVNKSFEENTILAGVPAKEIKKRN